MFLSKLDLNEEVLRDFYESKKTEVIIHGNYHYDEISNSYKTDEELKIEKREKVLPKNE